MLGIIQHIDLQGNWTTALQDLRFPLKDEVHVSGVSLTTRVSASSYWHPFPTRTVNQETGPLIPSAQKPSVSYTVISMASTRRNKQTTTKCKMRELSPKEGKESTGGTYLLGGYSCGAEALEQGTPAGLGW